MKVNYFFNIIQIYIILSCFAACKFKVEKLNLHPIKNDIVPIKGSYCSTWTKHARYSLAEPPFSVSCYNDGLWKDVGGLIDNTAECGNLKLEKYGYPQLFKSDNGDIYIGYKRCPGYSNQETIVKKYIEGEGWQNVSSSPVNFIDGKFVYDSTQFGSTFTVFNGIIKVFWKSAGKSYISYLSGNNWIHSELIDPEESASKRHPMFLKSSDKLYAYYGEPRPIVWDVTNPEPVLIGYVPIDIVSERSLYTSMIIWNGNPVIAYTSTNDINENWDNTTVSVKIAFFNGSSWTVDSNKIEETTSHDGIPPHLFVDSNNQLHIMYADFTTDGISTNASEITFRFRISKWNGNAWERIGGESEALILSQRFEFLNYNDSIIFSAVKRKILYKISEQVVIKWQAGSFAQVGSEVKTFSEFETLWRARPGNVIKISDENQTSLKNYSNSFYLLSTDKLSTPCIPNRCTHGFRLRSESIAIDAGTNDLPFCLSSDASADIGACEFYIY